MCMGLKLPSWMNEIPSGPNIMRVCVRTASRPVESLAPVKKKTRTVNFSAWWRLNGEIIYVTLDFFFYIFYCFIVFLPKPKHCCLSLWSPSSDTSGALFLSVCPQQCVQKCSYALNCILWSGTRVANKQRRKWCLHVWLLGRKLGRRNADGALESVSTEQPIGCVPSKTAPLKEVRVSCRR